MAFLETIEGSATAKTVSNDMESAAQLLDCPTHIDF